MIAGKQWTLNTGTPVILETRPVDPRSLFRGDYVRLNYAISTLHPDELEGDKEFKLHETIYVVLQKGDPFWKPVSAHKKRPETTDGQTAIRGVVRYVSNSFWNADTQKSENLRTVTVKYGIENYFVPEGEGRALERPKEDEKLSIKAAVDKRGNAGIKAVLINGEERYVEKLF